MEIQPLYAVLFFVLSENNIWALVGRDPKMGPNWTPMVPKGPPLGPKGPGSPMGPKGPFGGRRPTKGALGPYWRTLAAVPIGGGAIGTIIDSDGPSSKIESKVLLLAPASFFD